jgi:glycosyltransferase involved in cell wall biosynthesis
MIFITHTTFDDATIKDNYGAPQYSYHFVMKAFEPVLDRLGRREHVTAPQRDVDAIYAAAQARGEDCLFLSFSPPQLTPLGLACPTAPVFAWEYETIPDESWTDDPRQDWRYVFARTGMAFTLCQAAADAVRRSMGESYPIWVTPAPVFDRFAALRTEARGWREGFDLAVEGALAIDTRDFDLAPFRYERPARNAERALQMAQVAARAAAAPARALRLEGVVYTSVLCPRDSRKNWEDMVAGFVWAFRDTPTATLILKLTQAGLEDALAPILRFMAGLGRFDCRIVLIHGLLSDEAYAALIDATSYAVNTSVGEGQCMPLVEYMTCGRPAVAPAHTAMADYITSDNAFVVPSRERSAIWPHDDRGLQRSRNHQVSFAELVRRYRESYGAAQDPAWYARLSASAIRSVEAFCSEDVVAARLTEAIGWLGGESRAELRTA